MKGKVVCVFTLLLVMVLAGSGCASTKGGGVVDMMKKVPKACWSFTYIDIEAFRTDADLEEVFVLFS